MKLQSSNCNNWRSPLSDTATCKGYSRIALFTCNFFLWKWVSHIFRLSLSIRPDNRAWGKCWTWWVSLTLSNFHHFLSKILGIEQHSRVKSWFQEVLPGKPTPANSNFLMPAHKKTTGCERGKWRGSNFFFQVGLIKLVSFLFHFD